MDNIISEIINKQKIINKLNEDTILQNYFEQKNEVDLNQICSDMQISGRLICIEKIAEYYGLNEEESGYLVETGEISNFAYNAEDENIQILLKDNKIADISEVSELFNTSVLSRNVIKHFLCYPKGLDPA